MISKLSTLRVVAAAVAAVIAAPVTFAAAQEQRQAEPQGAEPREKGERMICRLVQDSVASRMGGTRVCRTREQWRQTERNN